jgi:hypothetical protein
VQALIASKNDCIYFPWEWPVEAVTCSDVKRRIRKSKLLRLTPPPKTSHNKWTVLHCITFQKAESFVTAVGTSNPTQHDLLSPCTIWDHPIQFYTLSSLHLLPDYQYCSKYYPTGGLVEGLPLLCLQTCINVFSV